MVTYITCFYRLTSANISYLAQIELFIKMGYVCTITKEMEQDLTQFAVPILCDDPTGCDEMGNYFAIEADTMTCIVSVVDMNKDWFEY